MSDGWQGLLDPGETVLWQGQPDPEVRFFRQDTSRTLFFAAFTAITLFMMLGIAGEGGFDWLLMLPFVAIGLHNLVFIHYWKAYERRHTHYTITSHRAMIATDIMGRRRLDSYPLLPESVLRLEENDGLSDIYFAETMSSVMGDRRDGIRRRRTRVKRVGFEQLRDGRRVYEILRHAQQARGAEPA